MPPFQPFAASWSRSERRDDLPRTPEPALDGDAQPPPPPRPRFRVKRRNVSNLNAPTQQFLAWVAAADLPIPSIKEPRVLDEEMADTMYPISRLSVMEDMPLTPHAHGGSDRMFSPPKAPALGVLPSLSIDSTLGSLESSPDYESSQPSTAHSTHTGTSLFSYFSISSEELSQCVSPETQHADHFSELSSAEDNDKTTKAATREVSRERLRRAPWTKPMIQHLWSTYMMYLQDPKVTPFLISKSGVPPHGVCLRVAWEAKRSWKRSKAQANADQTSGSIIPTAQGPSGPYVQWPHTCAATRAQLGELCKMDARTNARSNQYLAPSTTHGKSAARFWTRRSASARSPSVFSGQDMAMSLAASTSDSKQLQAPLAQLTSSHPDPQPKELRPPPPNVETSAPVAGIEPLESERTQLASPFAARSYGPSSSTSLPSSFIVDVKLQRRTHTGGPRRTLMSPVRLARGRSTQKRRPKRPSLGSELWVDPASIGDISSTNCEGTIM
ncbi:hypothetical protein EDB81DRAFT_301746 [Dactylonectria macrodidyma]|uniref:Uncharacterized protein n=1 Tax=Dactylonectria macrodidyma TaxID=307937 RepID=A0A9P9IAT4_9HYPO|nr:hypothetical protein EDB81DRAFT_301746 [Dactylonectria macrodidyma]